MEFLSQYFLFLAKLVSIIAGLLILLAGIFAISSKGKGKQKGELVVKKLNDEYQHYQQIMNTALDTKNVLKQQLKTNKKSRKKTGAIRQNLFILDFHGDIRASAVDSLSKEINALLLTAKPEDEVLVRLESAGGMVNAYGLAASQLQRIRDAKLKLTIAIDKVAASGGYMMACVADKIIAAPFSIVGSIGVVVQFPNFHRYLQSKNIDFEQLTAGNFKRTLTLFGENTKQGRQKLQTELDDAHHLFKSFIQGYRQNLDIEKVSTGEHWFATRAVDLGLVDHLQTSDDYLIKASKQRHLYQIQYKIKQPWSKKLTTNASNLFDKVLNHASTIKGQHYL